jgi:hypothetical protein
MKSLKDKIINNKEIILIVSSLIIIIGLVTYNILVHGVRP